MYTYSQQVAGAFFFWEDFMGDIIYVRLKVIKRSSELLKYRASKVFFFLLENTRGNKMFLKPWHIDSFLNKWRVFLICNTVFNSQRRRGDLGWSWFKNLARWLVVVWFGRCLGQARGLCSNPGCDHHCFSATRYSSQCGSFHPMQKGKPTLAKER